MAFKKATFSLTADAYGVATDTVHLPIVSDTTRVQYIEALALDDSAAFQPPQSLTLFESDEDDLESRQLCFVTRDNLLTTVFDVGDEGAPVATPQLLYPRVATISPAGGAASSTGGGRVILRAPYIIMRLDGCLASDVFTGYVYYETAGDLRF